MEPFRIIQIFVVQLGLGLFFLYLGVKILRRDTKKFNLLVFIFYLFIFISTIINIIYVNLEQVKYQQTVKVLHFLTLNFSSCSFIFLLVFNLILYKSEKVFDPKKQAMVTGFYLCINLIPLFLINNHLELGPSTDWYPDHDVVYFTVQTILFLAVCIPMLYYGFKVLNKFKSKPVKKKFKFYILGLITHIIAGQGILVSNYLSIPTFRITWAIIGLILIINTSVSIYRGLAKQISKD